jgi:hypothetical protein
MRKSSSSIQYASGFSLLVVLFACDKILSCFNPHSILFFQNRSFHVLHWSVPILCCFSFGLLLSPSCPHSWNAPRVFLNNRFLPSSAGAQRLTLFHAIQKCFHVKRSAPVAVGSACLTGRAIAPVCSDPGQQGLRSQGVLLGRGLSSLRVLRNAIVVSLSSYPQSWSQVPQDILAQHLPSSPWSHHPQPDGPLTSLSPSSPP